MLAAEIFAAGKNDPNSKAGQKKHETERVAMSAR
jgi:ribosomal protein S7